MAALKQVTVRVGESGYRAEISAGDHTLDADEPAALGGTNEGPTPYDYLAAALGTCRHWSAACASSLSRRNTPTLSSR